MSRFPEWLAGRRRAAGAAAVALLALGAVAWATRRSSDADPLVVRRGDLVLSVDVEGDLQALRAARLGPPALSDTEFKIAFLAPESSSVKRGQPVLRFDTQRLEEALLTQAAALEEATQRLEQKAVELELKLYGLDEELAKVQSELRKAQLKADVPEELVARIELQESRLALEGRQRELRALEARRAAARASSAAELRSLAAQRDRARARVAELRAGIASMTVPAPQDGIVVYTSDWRDEKRKVGDVVWMRETVVELPDLSEMKAAGDVDEADAGQVAPGQRVTLRLESRDDVDYTGRVTSVGRAVRRKSWRVPAKAFRVEIALDRSDPAMRPAMRFRGRIETARVPGLVLAPRRAVFLRAEGPVAFVRRLTGYVEVPLRLGRRNVHEVEVLAGLRPGDRLSPVDPAAGSEPPAAEAAP